MNTTNCFAVNTRHFLTLYTNARHDYLLFTLNLIGNYILVLKSTLKMPDTMMTFAWLRTYTNVDRLVGLCLASVYKNVITSTYDLFVCVCVFQRKVDHSYIERTQNGIRFSQILFEI